ncbi:MAG: hypothetical protein K0R18_439 [Bacillales bacterium]|jgi:hypothetical protein|nr:hypothetical protein [Bacillales bacterium]
MSLESQQDQIDLAINAIVKQIELLSRKCSMEDNRNDKNYKFENLIEASSIMLQLSRVLNELTVTQTILKNSNGSNQVDSMLNSILGRKM